jgi:SAM-dependent methyltransferase
VSEPIANLQWTSHNLAVGRLKRFARDWNKLGKSNPLGAILTGPAGELTEWNIEEFFATGKADADRFLADLERIAPAVPRRIALDFGCGVGRVTGALATNFESVIGVDAASTMVSRARVVNEALQNCQFVVNKESHLHRFPTGTFDVIYSRLVLQHIPPALVRAYVPELIRVLRPGGVLMFQMPDEIAPEPEEAFLDAPVVGKNRWKSRLPRVVVRAYRRLKYRLIVDESLPAMAIFGMAQPLVLRIIRDAGGTVLATVSDQAHGPLVPGYEYWVTK